MSNPAGRHGIDRITGDADIYALRASPSRKSREPDELQPGTLIGGRYRIERRLGGGAIGQVYECTNTWTTRRVALKLLRRDLADDPEIAQRFLIEARAATTVPHPNIVDVLDMGEDPESKHLYLVQEFLEGRDLHEHLRAHGPLTPEAARDVLLPVMHALATAHEKGVFHRDLKPENIFLVQTPEGDLYPKVIDFGLARINATAVNRVTRVGSVMGTPFYMSPEQARGEDDVDARTDVWAMGVIWYESLAGSVPFDGDNLQAVLHRIFMVDPVPLYERASQVTKEVSQAIHRALAREREARYPSMAAFLEAMASVLPEAPSSATGSVRGSRPGQSTSGRSRSTRPPRPSPTSTPGMPRGKLQVGPPRRPEATPALSTARPANEAFAVTLHATPTPASPTATGQGAAFVPYEMGPTAASLPEEGAGASSSVSLALAAAPAAQGVPAPGLATSLPEIAGLQREVQRLRVLLFVAIVALLAVATVALFMLRRDARPGVVYQVLGPSAPSPGLRRQGATDAGAQGTTPASAPTTVAAADASVGTWTDAAAPPTPAGERRASRHRSRREEGGDEGRSSRRSRRHRQE
jgi:serine/threonine-protein kinase